MDTTRRKYRIAGISYLLIIITGIFSHKVVRASIVIKGNASTTALNILNNSFLFNASIASDLVMILSYFGLGLSLYGLFHKTNRGVARGMLLLNVIGASMMALNMLNQYAAIAVLTSDVLGESFNTSHLESLSYFFMDLHGRGYEMATISYGIWLFPMGYLGIQSGKFPKIISYLLMLGAIGYSSSFFSSFFISNIPEALTIPADLGEFSLCFWLLFKGFKPLKEKIS